MKQRSRKVHGRVPAASPRPPLGWPSHSRFSVVLPSGQLGQSVWPGKVSWHWPGPSSGRCSPGTSSACNPASPERRKNPGKCSKSPPPGAPRLPPWPGTAGMLGRGCSGCFAFGNRASMAAGMRPWWLWDPQAAAGPPGGSGTPPAAGPRVAQPEEDRPPTLLPSCPYLN